MGLNLTSITIYGSDCPSKFDWAANIKKTGWIIHVYIKFNMKDETKVLFEVHPPLNMPRKKWKSLVFKTSSYKELKQWIKKHKKELSNE